MVFTSTTPWKPRNVKISKSSKLTKLNSVCTPSFRMPRKKSLWLRQYQSYISNWYINGKVFTSTNYNMGTKKFDFFSRKFEIEFDLYFDLCWRDEIIQVGLNMHLYVDIRDASSSLWRSTSSFQIIFFPYSLCFHFSSLQYFTVSFGLWLFCFPL